MMVLGKEYGSLTSGFLFLIYSAPSYSVYALVVKRRLQSVEAVAFSKLPPLKCLDGIPEACPLHIADDSHPRCLEFGDLKLGTLEARAALHNPGCKPTHPSHSPL